jgi:hypothetical protein
VVVVANLEFQISIMGQVAVAVAQKQVALLCQLQQITQ